MSELTTDTKGRSMIAIALIALGVISLMGMNLLWPAFFLVPGLILLACATMGGRTGAALCAIPGSLIAGTGALLFVQNLTGYWESWSYAWTLYGAFTGLGLTLMGQQFEDSHLKKIGRYLIRGSLLICAGFAVFFEVVLGVSGGIGPVGALMLIALGVFLMTRDSHRPDTSRLSGTSKPKRKTKPVSGKSKRDEALFTGPVVYGTRATESEIAAWRARQEAARTDDSALSRTDR